MYIRKITIDNVRAISNFEMMFPEGNEAGWHVLIGDNGAGKSTIVRSIAAVLIGPEQITAVLPVWDEWLSKGQNQGSIELLLKPDPKFDQHGRGQPTDKNISNKFSFKQNGRVALISNIDQKQLSPRNYNWSNNTGWFSVAYGPFRRFTGGEPRWNKVYYSAEKAGAHLSVFGEDIALTEALDWLKELDRRHLKEMEFSQTNAVKEPIQGYISSSGNILGFLKTFINAGGLLPPGTSFQHVDINGDIIFIDGNGLEIKVTQLSDGFRSILSLTFELLRQLEKTYGAQKVFANIQKGVNTIPLPGVVIIDEIDAHLHPTWQTRIGQWFTKYFPKLQFIVTSHSPLICRGCVNEAGELNGTVWRLAAPGSTEQSGLLDDTSRDRLIYGNVLDAYGTGVFGKTTSRSREGNEKMNRLAELNVKSRIGAITSKEETEMLDLKTIFPTHV